MSDRADDVIARLRRMKAQEDKKAGIGFTKYVRDYARALMEVPNVPVDVIQLASQGADEILQEMGDEPLDEAERRVLDAAAPEFGGQRLWFHRLFYGALYGRENGLTLAHERLVSWQANGEPGPGKEGA